MAQARPHDPPVFAGQQDMQVLMSWIFSMKHYLKVTATQDSLWVELASTYLGGAANTWYETWSPPVLARLIDVTPEASQHAVFIPWEMFVDAISRAFEPPDHYHQLRDDLYELKQMGSIAQYIQEFRAIRLQLAITEDEALDKFKRGLRPSTRRELIMRNPATVEEAILIANRHDKAWSRSKGVDQLVHQSTMVPSTSGPQPMEIDSVRAGQPFKKRTITELERMRVANLCYNCGKPGHIARNCQNTSLNTNSCYNCGKPGHIARNCRSKRTQVATVVALSEGSQENEKCQ
jgi:hypothetical protein